MGFYRGIALDGVVGDFFKTSLRVEGDDGDGRVMYHDGVCGLRACSC